MTSDQHRLWTSRGSPWYGIAKPLAILRDLLRAAGYTVYDRPNSEHLDAIPPEDHTPYSETNYPPVQEYGWGHAIDIMPPDPNKNLPSLQAIGKAIFDARQAGQVQWVKYMNWPSDGNLGRAVEDSWKPSHRRSGSTDTGHIHLSCTTGVLQLVSPFNPLTAGGIVLTGSVTPVGGLEAILDLEGPMFYAYTGSGATARWFVCNGQWSVEVPKAREADVRTLRDEGLIEFASYKTGPNTGKSSLDFPREGWTEAFGRLVPLTVMYGGNPVDSTTIAKAVVAGIQASGPAVVTGDNAEEAIVAALESPEGQAALATAAFTGAQEAETK